MVFRGCMSQTYGMDLYMYIYVDTYMKWIQKEKEIKSFFFDREREREYKMKHNHMYFEVCNTF